MESIVSAAASRVGKTVLHIDNQPTYGGDWASFNLENIQQLPKLCEDRKDTETAGLTCHVGTRSEIKDVQIQWHCKNESPK